MLAKSNREEGEKMPSKKITYRCEYCDKEFMTVNECERHEFTHIHSYTCATTERIAEELRNLSLAADGYRIGNTVMGIPIPNFKSLMKEAAKRLDSDSN